MLTSPGLIRSENPSFDVKGLAIIPLSIVVVAQVSFYIAHVDQRAHRSEVFPTINAKLNIQGLSLDLFGLLELAIMGQYYAQIIHCYECLKGVRLQGFFFESREFHVSTSLPQHGSQVR